MSTLKTISSALNLIDTKKENLKKAFEDLQSHSSFLNSLPLSWLELDSHFTEQQQSLNNRFHILQSLEQSHSQSPSKTLTLTSNPNGRTSNDANFLTNPNNPSSNQGILRVYCEKMDGVGLLNYVKDNFKDKIRVQEEILKAFRCAPDPGEIVRKSLEGFHDSFNDKRLRRMERSCITLLKILSVAGVSVSLKTRVKALKVAMDWKVRLIGDCTNILGALGFFYLIYAFGLVSEFSMDELVEFSSMAAVNGEFPQLCRDIGLTDRVPEIVQKLVDRGKHILAVKYVFDFNLADKIPPVSILKACVDESMKRSERLSQEGKSRKEITNREIHVLKLVIASIENHKLESEYPRASLEQRIEQLKGQNADMEHRTSASFLTQHPLQLRKRKKGMKKQNQQQNGIKLPQTFTSVGPTAVLNNVTNDNSTICHYKQPLVNPSGLFPQHPNPYMNSQAMTPPGMVVPTPTMPSYTGPSARPYGFAGIPTGPSENPSLGGSHLNSSEPLVRSAYYDRAFNYGGINLPHHHQASYYPQ